MVGGRIPAPNPTARPALPCSSRRNEPMAFPARMLLLLPAAFLASAVASRADEPLHTRIDALIGAKAASRPAAALADDAEFLRRIYLDLAGRIPSVAEARTFLDDKAPDKRTKLIDRLL